MKVRVGTALPVPTVPLVRVFAPLADGTREDESAEQEEPTDSGCRTDKPKVLGNTRDHAIGEPLMNAPRNDGEDKRRSDQRPPEHCHAALEVHEWRPRNESRASNDAERQLRSVRGERLGEARKKLRRAIRAQERTKPEGQQVQG